MTAITIEICLRCGVVHAMRLWCPLCGYPYPDVSDAERNDKRGVSDDL